jgi:ABC-type sugar transport system ATPase subunit
VRVRLEGYGAIGGRKILLGVRPQDFRPAGTGQHEVSGTVEIVEALGRASLVHFTLEDGGRAACEMQAEKARALRAGDPLLLSVVHERVHLFDAESESAIPRGHPSPIPSPNKLGEG